MRCVPLTMWLLAALDGTACGRPPTPEQIYESRRQAATRRIDEQRALDSAKVANAKPCSPPPLADTAGWVRTPRANARFAILLPPSFARDTSHALRFEHGGVRWVDSADSTREFLEIVGYWGVQSFPGRPLCRMPMGGRQALVALTSFAPHPSVSAFWHPGFGTLFTGRTRDPKDLVLLWTVLRTMADSTGALSPTAAPVP
jgi:hypothetical protein